MLLDTNIYRAYLDGLSLVFEELDKTDRANLPLAVLAEIRKGFLGGTKFQQNEDILQDFLEKTGAGIIVPTVQTADFFAELAVYCRKQGRALSDNDLWIAATALETGEPLLTLDKDFEVFQGYDGLTVIVL
jgi:predicted nucleic acid-binding protein